MAPALNGLRQTVKIPTLQLRHVLIITGILGILLGSMVFSSQHAVEQGQGLAGIVQYPPDDPTYIYNAKLWNFWGQFSAGALSLGASEHTVSLIVCALTGLLATWAFALWLWIFTKNGLFVILGSLVCIVLLENLRTAGVVGYSYPLLILESQYTYGKISLFYMAITLAVLGLGRFRLGALMLGLSLWVHPSLGLWMNLMFFIAILINFKNFETLRSWISPGKYLIAGYAISITSYLFQRLMYPVMYLDPAVAQEYLTAYIQNWDWHRSTGALDWSVNAFSEMVLVNLLGSVGVTAISKTNSSANIRFLLSCIVVFIALGIGFTIITTIPSTFSNLIAVLLPTRILNMCAVMYVGLLVGSFWQYREDIWLNIAFVLFLIIVITSPTPLTWGAATLFLIIRILRREAIPQHQLLLASILISAYVIMFSELLFPINVFKNAGLFICLVVVNGLLWYRPIFEFAYKQRIINGASIALRGFTLVILALNTIWLFEAKSIAYGDWIPSRGDNDTVWDAMVNGKGMLLAGIYTEGLSYATRRAVIFNSAIDGLPYAIEGAPKTANMLQAIYGIDFFNAPESLAHTSSYPLSEIRYNSMDELNPLSLEIKARWEARPEQEWIDLARQFDFTQILTRSDWALQLPAAARTDTMILYNIPNL